MPEADNLNLQNVDLSTLLEESDFLICTCAATKETEKIFNIDLFKKMRPTAIFINVSRGNVVDQDDLCFALKNNMIHAAGKYAQLLLIKLQLEKNWQQNIVCF